MNQSNWNNLLRRLGMANAEPVKRIAKMNALWGSTVESLENRALLSASSQCPDDSTVAAEVQLINRKRQPVTFPTVAGTWSVVATGQLPTTGQAVLTHPAPNSVESTITLTGLPVIHSSGKFTKKHHHEISDTVKVDVPVLGQKNLKFTITFGAGDNPTTFSGQVKLGKTVLANFVGTKQLS